MADRDIPPIVAPNNSDKAKTDARTEASKYRTPSAGVRPDDIPEDRQKREPVQNIKVKRRKKNIVQKILAQFIEEDAMSIKEFVIYEVVIPKLKDLIFDVGNGVLGRSLYGGSRPPSNVGRYGSSSYATPFTSYSSPSRYTSGSIQTKPITPPGTNRVRALPSKASMDDVIFDTRYEAEAVLNELLSIYSEYGTARVCDLYDLIGTTSDYTDIHFGWMRGVNGLETAYTDHVRDGWKLFLPSIRPID